MQQNIASDLAAGKNVTLPRNFNYNTNRQVPTMQLLSKLSKFDGQRKDAVVDTMKLDRDPSDLDLRDFAPSPASARQEEIRKASTARPAPTVLDPTYKPIDEKMAATEPLKRHNYNYNAHMNATVGKLFTSPAAVPDDAYIPTKRMANPRVSNMNNTLIGGQAPEDMYKTTANIALSGETLDKKNAHGKKMLKTFEPELFVSPITGEQIANYGNWVDDIQAKKAGAKPAVVNNTYEQDLKELEKTDPVMFKLKSQLGMRGARGVMGLGRLFRIMDDDGSKSLSLGEFKKAMQEFGMALNDTELVVLFKRFDTSNKGSISYDQFLRTIAGSLNARRKALVTQAFDILDKDGSGEIDLTDIAMSYDASQHPEVRSGKKTVEAVLTEFLEGFDVGGVSDNKVTRQEFENYYAGISASIDSDNYFELMMRNAWHISGGEGDAANSSNLRVLVTRIDGSQTVEEVKNDLGIKKGDTAAIISRLRAQGVPVKSISLLGGVDMDDGKNAGGAGGIGMPSPPRGDMSGRPSTAGGRGKRGAGGAGGRPGLGVGEGTAPPVHRSAEPSAGIKMIIEKIKVEMRSRGSGGYVGLQRRFRIMDDDGNKSLDLKEFKKAMKDLKIDISDGDLRMLFDHFDGDGSGSIDFDEFVQGVRAPLNEKRLKLVHQAFTILDKDGSGEVDAKEIASMYDASKHPEVLAKRKTSAQVLREFLDNFDVGGVKDGKVTRDEFANYYTNLGANIDNDEYFELMIRNAWHMVGGEGQAQNSANMAVMVTTSDLREERVIIQNDLGVKPNDIATIFARLRSQGVKDIYAINGKVIKVLNINGVDVVTIAGEASAINNPKADFSKPMVQRAPPRPQSAYAASIQARKSNTASGSAANTYAAPNRPVAGATPAVSAGPGNSASLGTNQSKLATSIVQNLQAQTQQQQKAVADDIVGGTLLDVLRVQLVSKGPSGIIDLQRKFIEMDSDNSNALDINEFNAALAKANLAFSESQVRALFSYLDSDKSGLIDYQELLVGIRGQMNPTLLILTHQIFDRLDPSGRNMISPQDLLLHYDAAKHPDVASKRRTAEDVMQELLDTFDVGGVHSGVVTRDEFVNYYHNISAAMQDDDYLEIILRRAWHVGEEVAVSKILHLKEQERQQQQQGKLMGRIQQAKEFGEGYDPVRRPSSSSYNSRNMAAQGMAQGLQGSSMTLNAPAGDQSMRRPSSASATGRQGRLNNMYNNNTTQAKTSALEEKIAVMKRQAVVLFNQNKFEESLAYFEEVLRMLQSIYPPNHPECIKGEKSIILVQRRLSQSRGG